MEHRLPQLCPRLTELSLRGWQSDALGGFLPRLGSACAAGCGADRPSLGRLSTLRLDRAGIRSFGAAIRALEGLASLTSLSLAGNPIATIDLGLEGGDAPCPEAAAAGAGGATAAGPGAESGAGPGAAAAAAAEPPPAPAAAPGGAGECAEAGGVVRGGLLGRLRSLDLSGSRIGDWRAVELLGRLPALRALRLTGVPLLDGMEPDIARMLCIARLPNVSAGGAGLQTVGSETCGRFNGAPVSRSDRREAEAFSERWDSGEWRRFREAHGRGDGAGGRADSAQVPRDSTAQAALARLG